MLRTLAISVLAFAATSLAVDVELSAFMELVNTPIFLSTETEDTSDVTISNPLVAKSTTFSFTLANTNLGEGDWSAIMQFDNYLANSTNHFINNITECTYGLSEFDGVTFSHTDVVNNLSNTTVTFPIEATQFSVTNNQVKIVCDVTYGFRTPTDSSNAVSAMVKKDGEEAAYVVEDVETPSAEFASLGTSTNFAVILSSTSDLSSFGTTLYTKMVTDLKEKAAELPESSSYRVAATADLTVEGGVVCGLASEVTGAPSGYACVSALKVDYAGDVDALMELKDGYDAKVTSEISGLPEDTSVEVQFVTNEVSGTCGDGIQDNGETDVDCGEEACYNTCEVGQSCDSGLDCSTYKCIDGKCSNSAASMSTVAAVAVVAAVAALFF